MVQRKETKKNEDIELDFFWFLNIFINFIQYICTSSKGIWPTIKLKCICLALFTKLEGMKHDDNVFLAKKKRL